MIDSDDFSSYGYSSHDTMSPIILDGSNKKIKSYDIDVNKNNKNNNNWEITRRDVQGRTLLHYFSFNGNIENAKKLFAQSFPVDLTDQALNSSLHVASQYGQWAMVAYLLEQNAFINRQNINGKTPLHLAVESEHKETVEILLSHGANPNMVDLEGATPLHYSSANGYLDISQCLLKHGAFVNYKDYSKETPLFWAIRESKIDQVDMLIKNGANINSKNDDGETPFDLAQEFDEEDITVLLQKALNYSTNFSYNYNVSIVNSVNSNINLPKSLPVNFVIPGKETGQMVEYRPQSL